MIGERNGETSGRGMNAGEADDNPFVSLARRAIEAYVREGRYIEGRLPEGSGPEGAGVFVSLHKPDGSLRGCLGTIAATRSSLSEEVVANAVAAASRDPRFGSVREEELNGLDIKVDVLHPPEGVEGVQDLDPARYGIIVRTEDGRQALLLPDLEGVETAEQQVQLACRKGGIHPTTDRYLLYRFEVIRHHRGA